MLSLIFLPLELAVGIILLPLRIILGMFRASRFMAIIMIAGVCSIFSGVISMICGSLQSLLPWILIAVGIALIVRSNRSHPEIRKDAFDSFYAQKKAAE